MIVPIHAILLQSYLVVSSSDGVVGLPDRNRQHPSSEALLDVVLALQVLYGLVPGAASGAVQLLSPSG